MNNFNIYKCKDGRLRIYLSDTKKVISYPKFLMEQKLGRKLRPTEQVHHIDGNPLNNDLDNLEIKILGEHQREHNVPKYQDKIVTCGWCGNTFVWTAKQQRDYYRNKRRIDRQDRISESPYCSKKCSGSYGKYMQSVK